jgi:hypothetical protein
MVKIYSLSITDPAALSEILSTHFITHLDVVIANAASLTTGVQASALLPKN